MCTRLCFLPIWYVYSCISAVADQQKAMWKMFKIKMTHKPQKQIVAGLEFTAKGKTLPTKTVVQLFVQSFCQDIPRALPSRCFDFSLTVDVYGISKAVLLRFFRRQWGVVCACLHLTLNNLMLFRQVVAHSHSCGHRSCTELNCVGYRCEGFFFF